MTPSLRRLLLDVVLLDGEQDAAPSLVDMARRAKAMLDAEGARKARRRVKAAPRIIREKATKAQRADNDATTRRIVFARCHSQCELCPPYSRLQAEELHHLGAGTLRKLYSGPNATCAACWHCHRAWHKSNPDVLCRSLDLAVAIGAPDIVQAAINRRIQKATKETA